MSLTSRCRLTRNRKINLKSRVGCRVGCHIEVIGHKNLTPINTVIRLFEDAHFLGLTFETSEEI